MKLIALCHNNKRYELELEDFDNGFASKFLDMYARISNEFTFGYSQVFFVLLLDNGKNQALLGHYWINGEVHDIPLACSKSAFTYACRRWQKQNNLVGLGAWLP
ncbi:hypothetical protein [Peromfec virus RodF5_12]|uniref:Uncharacterized protein n=1 Tax=Peromfec virus RodF5_12 TaxID=2929336 RepID=A0A976N337_9VIRU|nr:hypothetical protein [Peromfec virus RodF5_12]